MVGKSADGTGQSGQVVININSAPPGRLPWLRIAEAIVAVVLMVGGYMTWRWLNHVGDLLGGAFRPGTTSVGTTLHGATTRLKAEAKLVVLSVYCDVEISREIHSTILWGKIVTGGASVRIAAKDNMAQYYVPLQGLRADDFTYDGEHKTLLVRMPAPRVGRGDGFGPVRPRADLHLDGSALAEPEQVHGRVRASGGAQGSAAGGHQGRAK